MIINDLDGYYIVFDTKNWNTELDTLVVNILICCLQRSLRKSVGEHWRWSRWRVNPDANL